MIVKPRDRSGGALWTCPLDLVHHRALAALLERVVAFGWAHVLSRSGHAEVVGALRRNREPMIPLRFAVTVLVKRQRRDVWL